MAMAVYVSLTPVTEDGYGSVWQSKAINKQRIAMAVKISVKLVKEEGYGSVWQCKASYRGWLWQCMAV